MADARNEARRRIAEAINAAGCTPLEIDEHYELADAVLARFRFVEWKPACGHQGCPRSDCGRYLAFLAEPEFPDDVQRGADVGKIGEGTLERIKTHTPEASKGR